MSTLRIVNHTRGSVLATHAKIASTPRARTLGLIGVTAPEFPPGSGLFFPECAAIHTFGMLMTIDVLFIDMLKHRIQKSVRGAEPGCRISAQIPREICSVLELPAGVIAQTGSMRGDVIVIMAATHASPEELAGMSPLFHGMI